MAAPRQRAEGALQTLIVAVEVLRELPEERAELPAVGERLERLEEALDIRVQRLQPLDVRQVATGLDGEDETRRALLHPALDRRGGGQPVEGVVDLDRVEALGVVREPPALRQALGIETLAPVRVGPAGAADPNGLQRRFRTSTAMSSRGSPPWRWIAAWESCSAISSALLPAAVPSSLASQSGSS